MLQRIRFLLIYCSVYAAIGSVHLSLVRRWMKTIFEGLADLHSETATHKPMIHGRIRLPSLFYFRSTGQVRVGGYYWLTEMHPDKPYPQVQWAKEDRRLGDSVRRRLPRLLPGGGVSVGPLGSRRGHLRHGNEHSPPAERMPAVRRAGQRQLRSGRDPARRRVGER